MLFILLTERINKRSKRGKKTVFNKKTDHTIEN